MELSPARWRRALSRAALALLASSLLAGVGVLGSSAQAEAAPTTTFGTAAPTGIDKVDNDGALEVGMRFAPTTSGSVNAIRFYKATPSKTGTPLSVSLWSASGQRLASAAVTGTTATGWLTVNLKSPVKLSAKQEYTVSAFAFNGSYVASRNYFTSQRASGYVTMPKNAGVFTYNKQSRYPTEVYSASNYWIDPVFEPQSSVVPPVPTTKPTATQAPTTKPTATQAPTTKPTATQAPTTKPTATQAPSTQPTVAPSSGANTGLMGWQLNSKNVGLAPFGLTCESLPLYTGSMTPAAGSRISGVRIVGHLDLRNGDIVVERSCIMPGSGSAGGNSLSSMVSNFVCGRDDCPVISAKSVIIRDSEFNASAAPASQVGYACAFRGTGTLERNYMHGMGNGICFYGTGMKHDAIAEQNYVTNVRSYGDSHNEAATIRDFKLDENPNRVARFTRNRLDIAEGNITAGLFIQPTGENIDSLVVEGNLIEGGGYNLYLNQIPSGGRYSNVRATNNRFSSTGWGPHIVDGGSGWAQWSNNYRYDATKTDGQGTAVRAN